MNENLLAILLVVIVLGMFFAVGVMQYTKFSNLQSTLQSTNSIGYPKTAPLPIGYSNSPGLKSNPYVFDNGFQGVGYYLFTSQEFSKLQSIPASGININPMYIGNPSFYQSQKNWLNYTGYIIVQGEPQKA